MLNKYWALFLSLASVLYICIPLSAIAQNQTKDILFIGNSYTYFWNLPRQVEAMALSQSIDIVVDQSTSGGVNWGHHWRGDRGLESVALVKSGQYDVVVLQNHSMRTMEAPDSLMHFGELFSNIIDEVDGKPYLYVTWAREWDPTMQATITKVYQDLAEEIDATIIPVGPAWQTVRQLRPELRLFDKDGSHPSPVGSYLSACVMYATLFQESPVDLPERLTYRYADGELMYLNILSPEDAQFLQKVAEDIVRKFQKSSLVESN